MSNSFAFKSWLADMFKKIGVDITYRDLLYYKAKEVDTIFERYRPQIEQRMKLEEEAELKQQSRNIDENKIQYAAEVKQEVKQQETKVAETRTKVPKVYDDTVVINIPKLIRDFQNSELEELPIRIRNDQDLKDVINNLKVRINYNTTIRAGNSYIPIGSYKVKMEHFNSVETMNPSSDKEILLSLKKSKVIYIIQRKQGRNRVAGAFFPYLNTTVLDLSQYGIFKEVSPQNYNLNCLLHALSSVVPEEKLSLLKTMCITRNIPIAKLPAVAKFLRATIHLKRENGKTSKYGDGPLNIKLGLIDKHYFINNQFPITRYALKNIDKLSKYENFQNIEQETPLLRRNKKTNAFDVITELKAMNKFTPITINDTGILNTQYYKNIESKISVVNNTKSCCRKIECKPKSNEITRIYFADFETYTSDELHKAYMCCIIETELVDDKLVEKAKKTFYGDYCATSMLNFIKTSSIVYFHNLGYDFSFFKKYLNCRSIIKTGSLIKMVKGSYKGKTITFRDSYAMISTPLNKFSSMFNLTVKKEIMPYSLYTEESIKRTCLPIEEVFPHVKPNELEEFKKLAEEYTSDNYFNHIAYAEFYCKADCDVLFKGMSTFRSWIKTAFNLDVFAFVSLPSLSYRYFLETGCFEDVYEMCGPVRMYIQKCIVGGRVMTRDNKKWWIKDQKINDFDAVSLYPSAMARMGFLKGIPKKLTNLSMEFLSAVDGYFIRITNIKTTTKRHFPLQSTYEESSRNYTNEFPSDYVLSIDKIALEDFIKFQGATFDIIDGYYYDSGKNDKIQLVIRNVFEERLKKKASKNPIEVVYKLLMNAGYGKLIQKEIKDEYKFSNTRSQHESFVNYNHNFIKEYYNLAPDKYVYTLDKTINLHYNCAHIGCEILSMSKRIMNEVMCTAEDLNLSIYYQDTDSIHINDEDIKILADEYQTIYNRTLIGKHLGQFHSDFSGGNYAVESIFLGKKAYIDLLDTNITHERLKGVSSDAIKIKATSLASPEDNSNRPLSMKVYEELYNGTPISFDLAAGRHKFKRDKHFSQYTITEFIREVKF